MNVQDGRNGDAATVTTYYFSRIYNNVRVELSVVHLIWMTKL